jgi:hypothetical protein
LFILIASTAQLATNRETSLGIAAEWGAIFAAVFAFLVLVGSVGGWVWRRVTAAAIDHMLQVVEPQCAFERDAAGGLAVTLGLLVRNGSAGRAISYEPQRFTVRVAGGEHLLTDPVAIQDLGPGRTKGWLRDPVAITRADLPLRAEVEYEIFYGLQGRKMRRSIEGSFWTTLPQLEGEPEGRIIWRELQPERDSRLPWRSKHSRPIL